MYTSPLPESTATSAGPFSSVRLTPVLPTLPPPVPVQLIAPPRPSSQVNLDPMVSNKLRPSREYFCTTPSAVPAIQLLPWKSTKQPWTPLGSTAFCPANGCPVATLAGLPQVLN